MKKILVIGSLNTDFSISVNRVAKPGETIKAEGLLINNGGKGANQAYTIGKLGGNVSMLGKVGNDIYANEVIKSLSKVNVKTKKIKKEKNSETGKAFVFVGSNGENNIYIIEGANGEVTEKYIIENEKFIKKFDIILMQLEIPLSAIKKVLEIAKDKIIILDPAPANKELINFDLTNVYLMKPNESELAELTEITSTDEDSILEGAKKLLDKGVQNVLVSLGGNGSMLVNKNGHKKYEAKKSNVVDTTAAGDSFIASIALKLSEGYSLNDSILFANEVASLVVTRKGAQQSIPDIWEVK